MQTFDRVKAFTSYIMLSGLLNWKIRAPYSNTSPSVNFQIHARQKFTLIGRQEKQGISNVRRIGQSSERHITNEFCSVLSSVWDAGERFKAEI